VTRTFSTESLTGKDPVLGLPPDPEQDLAEAVKEVKAEMEARQRKGIRRADTAPEITD
jgi:lysophospholipid acyltransferase